MNSRRDLGDGLVLRRASAADTEALAQCAEKVHGEKASSEGVVAHWTRDLMSDDHPTSRGFTLVEDTRTGAIVSAVNMNSQVWSYAGVHLPVGRPELGGTDPAYRHRGLIRAQQEELHRWSESCGDIVQAIFGIPWFFRQFGYEPAISATSGCWGYGADVPKLKPGEAEPFSIRAARADDLPFISTVYHENMRRYLVSCVRDMRQWQADLEMRSARCRCLRIIEARTGEKVGFLAHQAPSSPNHPLDIFAYELAEGAAWDAITPSVIRYLLTGGEKGQPGEVPPREKFSITLARGHPAYAHVPYGKYYSDHEYAHYVRVPDMPRLLNTIAPALEERLAQSEFSDYTGELLISFYRNGIRLNITNGHITSNGWDLSGDAAAAFPDLVFTQLVFGFRSLVDLVYAFPDLKVTDTAAEVLNVLFPKIRSRLWLVS
jgi:hypothetical protein